jgi:jumonji domain-containing protein 7
MYQTGSYERLPDGSWSVQQSATAIPWIPIDPAEPVDTDLHPRYKHAKCVSVTLQRGDMLYLPALWFHRVSQTASSDPEAPLAIAINVSTITCASYLA